MFVCIYVYDERDLQIIKKLHLSKEYTLKANSHYTHTYVYNHVNNKII